MKKLQHLLLSGFLLGSISLTAQNFSNAVGARLGVPLSASYKMFLNDSDALEGYVAFRSRNNFSWVSVAGAYQRHNSFDLDAEFGPLQWYYGAGASVFFYNYDFPTIPGVENDFATVALGLQGYLGLQYAFDDIPLEITADWIPTIYIGNGYNTGFGAGFGSLGVRYILNR